MCKTNDKNFEEMLKDKNFESIGINDEFGFECKQCGQCCMNRNDIILMPYDVYKIAKALNITTKEFLQKYTKNTFGYTSHMPICVLKSEDNGFCPFLKFDYLSGNNKFKCSINDYKPGVCYNHPIGIITDGNEDVDISNIDDVKNIHFIKVKQCANSHSDKMHKVSDWVKDYMNNIKEYNISRKIIFDVSKGINFTKVSLVLGCLGIIDVINNKKINDLEFKDLSSMSNEDICNIVLSKTVSASDMFHYIHEVSFMNMYKKYDTSKPFIEQCIKNIDDFKVVAKYFNENIFDKFINDFKSKFTLNVDEYMDKIKNENIPVEEIIRKLVPEYISLIK